MAIEQAFAFMSALYFRGKVAYAQRFATPPEGVGAGAWVIAPGFGLVPFGWRMNIDRFKKLKRTEVDAKRPSYCRPLQKEAKSLAAQLPDDTRVVLLGSIATGKYVDVLWPIFGERLVFPRCFVGLGDMSRGGLMLRAARSGEEFEYSGLNVQRSNAKGTKRRADS